MTTSPEEPKGNKVVNGIVALIMAAGGVYLIYQCVKLFTL